MSTLVVDMTGGRAQRVLSPNEEIPRFYNISLDVTSACARDKASGKFGSASTKLGVLGTIGVLYKHFKVPPVFWAADPKRVEARGIATEYFFLTDLFWQVPGLDGINDACVWNKRYLIQGYPTQSLRGAHRCVSMD